MYYISEIREYDKKRKKLILNEGEEVLLLYRSELKDARLSEGDTIREEEWDRLLQEVLIPRGKKKALYYLKDSDKSRSQVREKLRQGFYPKEAVEAVMDFLEQHHFVDDRRFAEQYILSVKGKKSGREILYKLLEKGVPEQAARELLEELIPGQEEAEACRKALKSRLGGKNAPDRLQELPYQEKQKICAALYRRGFSREAVEQAFASFFENEA